MTAKETVARIDACSDEALALHDRIKLVGIEADFPYPHHRNADHVADLLGAAHRSLAEAARRIAKVTAPAQHDQEPA